MMISRRYVKSCLGKIYLMVLGFVLHDKSITGIRAKRIQFELGVLIVFYLLYVLVNYFQLNIIAPIHISERFDYQYQFFDIKLSIFLPLLMMIILYVVIASHVYKLLLNQLPLFVNRVQRKFKKAKLDDLKSILYNTREAKETVTSANSIVSISVTLLTAVLTGNSFAIIGLKVFAISSFLAYMMLIIDLNIHFYFRIIAIIERLIREKEHSC